MFYENDVYSAAASVTVWQEIPVTPSCKQIWCDIYSVSGSQVAHIRGLIDKYITSLTDTGYVGTTSYEVDVSLSSSVLLAYGLNGTYGANCYLRFYKKR